MHKIHPCFLQPLGGDPQIVLPPWEVSSSAAFCEEFEHPVKVDVMLAFDKLASECILEVLDSNCASFSWVSQSVSVK